MSDREPQTNEIFNSEGNNNIKKIKKFIRLPRLTIEKIIRLSILTFGTVYMIINFFKGQAISHYTPYCLDDMSHNITSSINNFLYTHLSINYIIKAIFSILIDIGIIYTLIVWSLFSNNIRLLSTGVSYTLFNILVRFIHKTVQPANAAFTQEHFFSIFVNYQITTYSFFSLVLGLIVICAFEWKRNYNEFFFWYFISLFLAESIIMIIMQGHFFHEIFTAWVCGHYLFIMNEKLLCWIYGKDYLKLNNNLNVEINKIKGKNEFIPEVNENNNNNNNNKNVDGLKQKAEEAKQNLEKNLNN